MSAQDHTLEYNVKKSNITAKFPNRFKFIVHEKTGRYKARCSLTRNEIIDAALHLIGEKCAGRRVMDNPNDVRKFAMLYLSEEPREVFACMFLDNKNQLISFVKLFFGTINQAAVYPREVAKKALEYNAAAIIICHNHPSGNPSPSNSDKCITTVIEKTLSLLDIQLLDHIVVGGNESISFAEKGLL